jgi:hypothetical protein
MDGTKLSNWSSPVGRNSEQRLFPQWRASPSAPLKQAVPASRSYFPSLADHPDVETYSIASDEAVEIAFLIS